MERVSGIWRQYKPYLDGAECIELPKPKLEYIDPFGAELAFSMHAMQKDHLVSPKLLSYWEKVAKEYPRVNTGLQEDLVRYDGVWFRQPDEGICVPYAISNAIHRLDQPLPYLYLSRMINLANVTDEDYPEGGLSYYKTVPRLNCYPDFPVDFFKIQLYKPPALVGEFNEVKYKQVIRSNSRTISKFVGDNGAILTGIENTTLYTGAESVDNHAVVISGYSVDADGFMNVQVIDSVLGKVWLGLEYFSSTLCYDPQKTQEAYGVLPKEAGYHYSESNSRLARIS